MLSASLSVVLQQNLLQLHALPVNDTVSCRHALPTLTLELTAATLSLVSRF